MSMTYCLRSVSQRSPLSRRWRAGRTRSRWERRWRSYEEPYRVSALRWRQLCYRSRGRSEYRTKRRAAGRGWSPGSWGVWSETDIMLNLEWDATLLGNREAYRLHNDILYLASNGWYATAILATKPAERRNMTVRTNRIGNTNTSITKNCKRNNTVEADLIAREMLAFPSKSSGNKNDSDPINGKTTPIYVRYDGHNFYSKFQR